MCATGPGTVCQTRTAVAKHALYAELLQVRLDLFPKGINRKNVKVGWIKTLVVN